MSTYLQRDEDGNPTVTPFGKPLPSHAQTAGAESARESVRAAATARASRITRADVEAAYVHPEPEVKAHEIMWFVSLGASGARSLAKLAEANGHRVKATHNRGTTSPKWHVNSPDNKSNPGPPVDPSQYHGEVVDCETVYVVANRGEYIADGACQKVRGVWLNGKLDRIEVDGVETTLKAAREVLSL